MDDYNAVLSQIYSAECVATLRTNLCKMVNNDNSDRTDTLSNDELNCLLDILTLEIIRSGDNPDNLTASRQNVYFELIYGLENKLRHDILFP